VYAGEGSPREVPRAPIRRGQCRRRRVDAVCPPPSVRSSTPTVSTPRATVQPSALLLYAEGEVYAEGHACSAEGGVRRGATPRAAVGVAYAEGNALDADGYMPSAYSFIPVVPCIERNYQQKLSLRLDGQAGFARPAYQPS
jgi:hypothetical protein